MEAAAPPPCLHPEVARLSDENRDLKQELGSLRASVRALVALQDIIQRMTPDADPLVLIDDLLASALKAVGSSDGSLLLRDEETEERVVARGHGEARARPAE